MLFHPIGTFHGNVDAFSSLVYCYSPITDEYLNPNSTFQLCLTGKGQICGIGTVDSLGRVDNSWGISGG